MAGRSCAPEAGLSFDEFATCVKLVGRKCDESRSDGRLVKFEALAVPPAPRKRSLCLNLITIWTYLAWYL